MDGECERFAHGWRKASCDSTTSKPHAALAQRLRTPQDSLDSTLNRLATQFMKLGSSSPIIGITTYGRNTDDQVYLFANYLDALRRAGAVPILLPPGEHQCDRLLSLIDGLVLTGGGDIDPQRYGGSGHPTIYRVDPERDRFEMHLAQLALQQPKPILGICRGLQLLSLVSGAQTLVPHIPDVFGTQTLHRTEQARPIEHPVYLNPGSRLAALMGAETISVVSWHHQAVDVPVPGWTVTGRAADGLLEAMEHDTHPWAIAVQWHPEMSHPDDPHQSALLTAFVRAAQASQVVDPVLPQS